MDFDIHVHTSMEGDLRYISLPEKLREEMGALVGQFLQLRGSCEVVLKISRPLETNQQHAYASSEVIEKLQQSDVEFEILDVTLGCDPEFFITHNNRSVMAADYLPFKGQIGSDGGLGELRPMYGRHEDQVVANLRALIPKIPQEVRKARSRPYWMSRNVPSFTYQAHSYFSYLPAGFHVHLGIPPEILNTSKDFNRAAMNHIIRCLDWYVSVPLIPLEVCHERRTDSGQYGKPGDYRPKNVTLEYRTPGGFYLRSPKLARGLLGLTLMVTENVVSRMKVASGGFVNLHKLSPTDLQEIMPLPEPTEAIAMLRNKDPKITSNVLPGIYNQLADLPTFPSHSEAINEFFRAVKNVERPTADLLRNWEEQA